MISRDTGDAKKCAFYARSLDVNQNAYANLYCFSLYSVLLQQWNSISKPRINGDVSCTYVDCAVRYFRDRGQHSWGHDFATICCVWKQINSGASVLVFNSSSNKNCCVEIWKQAFVTNQERVLLHSSLHKNQDNAAIYVSNQESNRTSIVLEIDGQQVLSITERHQCTQQRFAAGMHWKRQHSLSAVNRWWDAPDKALGRARDLPRGSVITIMTSNRAIFLYISNAVVSSWHPVAA